MRVSWPHISLLAVLVSGCLIRYQWVAPEQAVFVTKHLIHAHSHLALIGWLYPMLMAAAFAAMGKERQEPWWYHGLVAMMTVAFLLQGYAAASIALSSVLLIWMSVTAIRALFRKTSFAWRVALASLLVSHIGPFALAGGAFMGPEWIRGWVTFYLHLQFSGWVVIGVLARMSARATGIGWLAIGLPFLLEPYFRTADTPLWMQCVGLAGGSATVFGTWRWIRADPRFGMAHMALAMKAAAQFASAIPIVGHTLLQTHLLGIAFAHLVLLGLATPMLLDRPSPWFAIGAWTMIGSLTGFGLAQWAGIPVFLPTQDVLLGTGLVTLAGAALTFIRQPSQIRIPS